MAALSLREFEAEARARLEPRVFDLFAGGADDEATLRENEAALGRLRLLPRVLRGRARRELHTTLLGSPISLPVVVAPTAFHRLAHPDGELATARAAAAARTILISGLASTVAIEEVAAVHPGSLWFQIYLQPDLEFTESVIRRAEAAGCRALVVTVDSPVFGRRERDLRSGFLDLPPGLCCENMRERRPNGFTGPARSIAFSSEITWDHIGWLKKVTRLPLVLKGILHPADARLAVSHGADAIVVSNHGGRQLDSTPATIDVLPAIALAVRGKVPILVDGGFRRGTDVVKALALGASAVALGRPILWGLAARGEAGVAEVLELLRAEIDRALALCGCGSIAEVTRDLVWPPGELGP